MTAIALAIPQEVEEKAEHHPRYPGFVQVSSVDVDAGCVWVGDPCYIIRDAGDQRPTDLGANWHDLCGRFFERSGYNAAQKAFQDHQYRAKSEIQKTPEYRERLEAYMAALKESTAEERRSVGKDFFAWEREQEMAWLDANPFNPAEKIDKGFANFSHNMGHGGMGTMINTNYGDGTYPVYIKYGKNGRPSMVLIDFYSGDSEFAMPVKEHDDIYSLDAFKELVRSGSIIDSDGDAYACNGTHYDIDEPIDLSMLDYLDDEVTHILWANK